MNFSQADYIANYNKSNYKMYQFRVKRENKETINFLDEIKNKNAYINSLIEKDINNSVYSIKQIKTIIKPILTKYGITDVYLFGSYARGEANNDSDIDIYCDRGNIKTLIDLGMLEEELQSALKKPVDIVFTTSIMDDFFKSQLDEDKIKIC